MERVQTFLKWFSTWGRSFLRRYWVGTLVIAVVSLVFFWPMVTRIGTYSEGGDAMFNAWTLSRDHHCILHQGCPNYADGNIYFPNKDSMLYSETQLSTAAVSLPLHFIDQNPIFAYNVMTILSFFLSGWFMYLLAKRLSKGNELFSIMAGLIFELGPMRMSGVSHLQNLSIFCLPLIVLLVLKYFEKAKKAFLVGLFLACLYLFFASWYQMVFGLVAIGTLLVAAVAIKMVPWRQAARVLAVVLLAALMTLPLAMQYTRFSRQNSAGFSIGEQVYYSSSVADYGLPNNGTHFGRFVYDHTKNVQVNAYNRDSVSYHGYVLYASAIAVIVAAFMWRKKSKENKQQYKLIVLFGAVAIVGFIMSLGPLLKIGGTDSFGQQEGYRLVIPMPYALVDVLLPQLSFIRAIGRASILVLFALCSLFALVPLYLQASKFKARTKKILVGLIVLFVFLELMPAHRVFMSQNAYSYNMHIPAVYSYIEKNSSIDNIVVLRSHDYPNAPIPIARAEDVLWAGYHNRNIFNGYSGYEPPKYGFQIYDFTDFGADDPPKLQALGLKYVLVDKQLSDEKLVSAVRANLDGKVYEDGRYVLFVL